LEGFKVVGSFDVDQIECSDLANHVIQLGIILYSSELFNEKFLIKMRDCVLKLKEDHPLKLWLKWVSATPPVTKKTQERITFLSEIINSQFNLITDQKVKNQIIEVIGEIPQDTIFEQVLRSQLYLVIGNVTKSDSILKDIIRKPPIENWRGYSPRHSFYHVLARQNVQQVLERLGRHPVDRKTFNLFCLYFKNYANDSVLIEMLEEMNLENLHSRLDLKFMEHLAPHLIHFLRLKRSDTGRQIEKLQDAKIFPIETQMYWVWPFLDVDPYVSQNLVMELEALHEKDLLWFNYLMDREKLADIYTSKTGKSFLPGRRQFIRSKLDSEKDFMLALFKLLEIGDIDESLVRKTVHSLRHD
jgi:hypothetical protein